MNFNRETFFSGYRSSFGGLNQQQVDGLNFLLDQLEQDAFTLNQVSYILATIDHETAHTFQPIKERRERATSPRRANQDRYWLTGFYGRGFVQITWRHNYKIFGIEDTPDKALEPATAYNIASRGMKEGVFTGKKLSDYIINGKVDYRNARKVINGLDRADEIASRARKYEAILERSAGADQSKSDADKPAPSDSASVQTVSTEPPVVEVKAPSTSITTKIAAATSAAAPVVSAIGLKIGGVEFKTGGLIAFAAVLIVGMVLAAYLWNESQKRRADAQKLGMINLADRNKNSVVAAGSQGDT